MINLEGNTNIKQFPEIYNSNNAEIIGKIAYLENKLSELSEEFVEYKSRICTRLRELEARVVNFEGQKEELKMYIIDYLNSEYDGSDSDI